MSHRRSLVFFHSLSQLKIQRKDHVSISKESKQKQLFFLRIWNLRFTRKKKQSLKLRKKLKMSSTLNDVNMNQILIYLNDI